MRQVIRQIANNPYAPGQMDILIPRTGYLAALWIRFAGSADITTAGAPGWRAPWSLLLNARVNINGSVFPMSADGYGFELLGRAMDPGTQDDSEMPSATATGAAPVRFTTRLPLTVDNENMTGIIDTGNAATTIYLELNFRGPTDPAFSAAVQTLTGTVEVWGESYLFGNGEPTPDLSTLHTFTVKKTNLTTTGDIQVNLPTLNQVYTRIITVLENDNAALGYTAGLALQLAIENYENPYTLTDGKMESMQNRLYHGKLPLSTGARILDLYTTKTLRDVVNATGLTLLQDILTIPSGVTLAQPANAYTYTEALTPLS